ncbi:hypothetical protein ABZW10_36475 [Kitasatospora sp. NPDC004723]|uniref:hypothetical protein n=1 Tax=Kitasatospora sp. NPDC004723 TaxID=3154288 RepID=UPI0033A6113F
MTGVYQPQTIVPTPVQTPVQPFAVPAVPVAPVLQQYVITDASGQQVIVTGTAQAVGQPLAAGYQAVPAPPAVAAAAPVDPVVPVWMIRAAIGALVLGAGAFGVQFLAGALEHLVHALGELIRLLVVLVAILLGGGTGVWVLKTVLSDRAAGTGRGAGEQGAGVVQSVTTNVAVSLVNQVSGRRGRNNA